MRKRMIVVVALILSVLSVSGAAFALDTTSDEVTIDGTGKLSAHGVGNVAIEGAGWVKIKMNGDITIVDNAGDASIRIRPFGHHWERSDDTTVVLEDFKGVIVVRGSDFTIEAEGRFRRIFAKGTGVAFLQGRGWYRATGGYFGTWTPGGVRVNYSL
ncbi:MAG: hypothetical protein WD184_10355 [Acidimicrobiia bacterium]